MKPKVRNAVLALVAILGVTNCQVALYPVARAFGSPPESDLATCREAFGRLQQRLATSRVRVEPVLFVHGSGRTWRLAMAQALVEEAAAHTAANFEIAAGRPDVAPRNIGHNQMRYLWERAADYAHWLKATRPETDYVLCTEIWARQDRVEGIHVYVFTAEGQIAYCRLFNSHHFGNSLPAEGVAHVRLMVKQLFDDLRLDAAVVFPPYGIG